MKRARQKVGGFWSEDWRGARIEMYPKLVVVEGWPARAVDLGRVRTCEACGRVTTHVGYSAVIDVGKPGSLERARALCLACAMIADSVGAGRTERGMLDAAEETDRR